jgi:tetratricopeptide (TPR) repeat protein
MGVAHAFLGMRSFPVCSLRPVVRVVGVLVIGISQIAGESTARGDSAPVTAASEDADGDRPDIYAPPPPTPEQQKTIKGLRTEADATLSSGDFDRARREFEQILKIAPNDASAQRDAARAAQAAGEFEYSAEALERAHHFEGHKRDPELHYLRGEALFVLGRIDEARREHRIAELEMGDFPTDRMEKLWLARIYARRGFYVLADRIYDRMWPDAPSFDAEVGLNQADAHVMNEDWDGAIRVLGRYLSRDSGNIRGREMLAWALEVKGDLDAELAVRQGLVVDAPTAANLNDYGRALERAADYPGARDEYADALRAGATDPAGTLATSALRMRLRMTPELAGAFSARSDSQANALRLQAGLALPFGQRHVVSMVTWRDESRGGFPSASGSVTGLGAAVQLVARGGASLIAGGDVRYDSASVSGNIAAGGTVPRSDRQTWRAGAQAEVDALLGAYAQINAHGGYDEQWAESPITIQEGGTADAVTAHFFLFPRDRRLLLDAGTQLRRLTLAPRIGDAEPHADQALFFIGGDIMLWNNPLRLLRGEFVDEHMLRRTYLNDAGVLSYRHYQLFSDSDPAFQSRIALAPRASIDNLSLAIRKVFARGRVGLDLRGGGGYDNERKRTLSQAGVSLLIAPTWFSRIGLSYDMSHETATGLSGTLHTGWVTYHADL